MLTRRSSGFTLAELVVAIALSGIIVLLCTKVYLIFIPQFRNNIQDAETSYASMLKVSGLETLLKSNVYGAVQPLGQASFIHIKDWAQKLRRNNRAPDSLAIEWELNQFSHDSLYMIKDHELVSHYENLSEYEQDHLYLKAVTLELTKREDTKTEAYFLYGDSPNLARVKVKEMIE